MNRQFASAIGANDLARIAAVTGEAENVSSRYHRILVRRSEPTFVTATKQQSTWNAILSSLQQITPPAKPVNQWVFKSGEHEIRAFPNGHVQGGDFDVSAVTGDAVELGKLGPHPVVPNPPIPVFDGTVFRGGKQTLDGIEWKNVTFVGTHISYRGGVVKLEGVKFVNCSFELPPDTRGAKLAQYVALSLPTLNFGSAPS